MRVTSLAREAIKDVTSGTVRVFLFTGITGIVLTVLALGDLLGAERILVDARVFQQSGASVVTVIAPGRISGSACEAVRTLPGVRSAGALRSSSTPLTSVLLPAAPLPVFETTAGLPEVLDAAREKTSGIYVPTALRDALAENSIGSLIAANGTVAVAGTFFYPQDGRRVGFGWAVLVPVADGAAFDECWVSTWPTSTEVRPLLPGVVMNGGDEKSASVQYGQLNARRGESFDGFGQWSGRTTRWVAPAAAIFGAALAFVAVRRRRLELATRLHDGMRKADLHLLMLAENATWGASSVVLAAAAGCIAALRIPPPDGIALALSASMTSLIGGLGALLGVMVATAMVREDHLFRYFQRR